MREPRPLTDADLERLCDHISKGESLRSWCEAEERDHSTVLRWLRNEERQKVYREARRMQADAHIDQLIELSDSPVERDGDGRIDTGAVQQLRVRIDTRKWVAAKFYPALYGDKLEVGGSLGVDVSNMKPADIVQKIATLLAAHGLAVLPAATPDPPEGA